MLSVERSIPHTLGQGDPPLDPQGDGESPTRRYLAVGLLVLPRAAPWLVLTFAVAVRLWQLDLTRFTGDETHYVSAAISMLDTHNLLPPSDLVFSIFVRIPPLYFYILAAFAAVNRDPLWIAGCIAVLNSLGTLLVYLAALRLSRSRLTALAAALLYAVNPAAIVYGRMIPNTELLPFFSALGLFGIVDFWQRRRPWSLAVALVAVGWAVQVHLVAFPMCVVWLAVCLARRRDLAGKALAVAAGVVALPLAPFAYSEVRLGWPDVGAFLHFSAGKSVTDLQALRTAAEVAGPALFSSHYLNGGPAQPHIDVTTWLLIGLAALGAFVTLRVSRGAGAILAAWVLLPILLSLRHPLEVGPYYLLTILPAMAVLEAMALSALPGLGRCLPARFGPPSARAPTLGGGCILLLAGLVASDLLSYSAFLAKAASDPVHGDYIVPMRYARETAAAIKPLVGSQPVYFLAPNIDRFAMPFFVAPSGPWRWAPPASYAVFPQSARWQLVQYAAPTRQFLEQELGPPVTRVDSSTGLPEFELLPIPADFEDRLLSRPGTIPTQAAFGSGITLRGVLPATLAAGSASPLQLVWQVTDAAAIHGRRLSEFAHLVDGSGTVWSTGGDVWNIVEEWQPGDLVVAPLELDIRPDAPTGGYWLDTGFYETFSGQPLGTSARIGPVRVAGRPQGLPTTPPIATFGQAELALTGVRWQGEDVALDWQALSAPRAGYTVFVHAVDPAGKLVAQHDGIPQGGAYPTTLWQAGDLVQDVHHLGLAWRPGLRLEIGLYTEPDLHRVPVRRDASPNPADHLVVEPPELVVTQGP